MLLMGTIALLSPYLLINLLDRLNLILSIARYLRTTVDVMIFEGYILRLFALCLFQLWA